MSKNNEKEHAFFIAPVTKPGLVEAPEGWEFSGSPMVVDHGPDTFLAFPVEKK